MNRHACNVNTPDMPSSYIHTWFYWSFIIVKMSTEPQLRLACFGTTHTEKTRSWSFSFATHMLTQPTEGLLKPHKNHVKYRNTHTVYSHTFQTDLMTYTFATTAPRTKFGYLNCLNCFACAPPGQDCTAVTVCKHSSFQKRQDDKMRRYMITVLGF